MRYCSQIAHKLDLMRTKESWLQTEMQVVMWRTLIMIQIL